jgi:hypothetical protein
MSNNQPNTNPGDVAELNKTTDPHLQAQIAHLTEFIGKTP